MAQDNEERVLRSKYLDWCSARVAEAFLKLTPEEIFELVEDRETRPVEAVAGEVGESGVSDFAPAGDSPGNAQPSSYRAIVARVTEVLAARLELPGFEEWLRAYRESPERYESELLGFWRQAADSGG